MADRLGHYRLLNKLGTGGMGTVYRADDTRTGQTVAVKVLHPHLAADPGYIRRFHREAQIAQNLDSPHIVKVLDFGQEGDSHFLTMEFVEGKTLAEVIQKEGPLPTQRAVAIASQIAQALDEAHRKGIVHRDIKPQNVIITKDGRVKVTDFGIARILGQTTVTASGTFLGTPQYVSPDYLTGRVDIRSDIYSLGIVLYQMLTGSVPFQADTPWAVLEMHRSKAPPPLAGLRPDVPPSLAQVVERCLDKRPERRFQTPRELQAALEVEGSVLAAGERRTVVIGPGEGGGGGGAGVVAPPTEPEPRGARRPAGGRPRGLWVAFAAAGFTGFAAAAIVIGLAIAGGGSGDGLSEPPTSTGTPRTTGIRITTASATRTATPHLAMPTATAHPETPTVAASPAASPTPTPAPSREGEVHFTGTLVYAEGECLPEAVCFLEVIVSNVIGGSNVEGPMTVDYASFCVDQLEPLIVNDPAAATGWEVEVMGMYDQRFPPPWVVDVCSSGDYYVRLVSVPAPGETPPPVPTFPVVSAPAIFYGSVGIDSVPAVGFSVGVDAFVRHALCGYTNTNAADGTYEISVAANGLEPQCGYDGAEVQFRIRSGPDFLNAGSTTWQSGTRSRLDLNGQSPPW